MNKNIFNINLLEHQIEGVKFALKHKKVCLFHGIGTGKTFTALEFLEHLPSGKVLIVAPPKPYKDIWSSDKFYVSGEFIDKTILFNTEQLHNVTYTTYNRIAISDTIMNEYYDYIVLDEVHRVKGRSTKSSKKMRTLCKKAKYVLGLTGTPVANNYIDVYNIYRNTDIEVFNVSYDTFVNTYYYTKRHDVTPYVSINLPVSVKPFNEPELIKQIGTRSMVKKTEDCVDLPESTIIEEFSTGMNTDKYSELLNGIIRTEEYEDTMTKLESINKAHQASNGYFYDKDKNVIKIKDNVKLKNLKEILSDRLEETERAIIVYYFKEDLRQLENEFSKIYKTTTEPSDFMDCQILFMQYQQSEGLNLQYCNLMIFYTYNYSYLNFEQMVGRIRRRGQNRNIIIYVMINKNTIEEKIYKAIKYKQSLDEYLKNTLG